MLERQFVARESSGALTDEFTKSPLLARIYAGRGVSSNKELDYRLAAMVPPAAFSPEMQKAVLRLEQAMKAQERMVVVGDFDVDGATSTALLVHALKKMGAQEVEFLVPDRVTFGYGLSPELVEFSSYLEPQLIITVDNGVASLEGVQRAKEQGIDVVVTDHHLPGKALPDAVAIVNPNLEGETFPSKSLPGVGVVFYLLIALRQHLREQGWFEGRDIPLPNLADYLDLVALGTVADVVPLDFNNRILVAQGLQRIRSGACRPGISAIFEVAGRARETCQATDLGFTIGPRLNAAGRLDSMSHGIECLLAEDEATAKAYAEELDALNQERRSLQSGMEAEAKAILSSLPLNQNKVPKALCVYDEGWHQGVVGIVASRIKEQFHRPVIVFAQGEDGSLKGSARSIPGVHIRDVLDRVATRNPGLVTKFGGHAMAAGLSLDRDQFELFSEQLILAVEAMTTPEIFEPIELTDGELSMTDMSLESALLIERSGPWGQAFPEPLFQGRFSIRQRRVLKEKHLKLVLTSEQGGAEIDAIVFNTECDRWPEIGGAFECTYRLAVNRFRGNESLQLMIQDVRFDT